jgi:molybdate transport system substrate-binding protein
MKKQLVLLVIGLFLAPLQAQVTPAVAANMKFAFEEIASAFTATEGIGVTPVYGSSGKLVTQIRNGAPYDIFISADVAFADSVCVSKLSVVKPMVYAYGKLVLWTTKSLDLSQGAAILSDDKVKSIAVGDLKLTVYGPAAREFLEKEQLWLKLEPKVVYGENIAKVAQFIECGAADIGFCAKSLVLSDEMKGKGTWVDIDSTKYKPLPQAAVILVYGETNNRKSSHKLYDFLYSKAAQQILRKYGYSVP